MAASLVFIVFTLALQTVVFRNTVHATTPYSQLEDEFLKVVREVNGKRNVMNEVDLGIIESIKTKVLEYCKKGILCELPGLPPTLSTGQLIPAKAYILIQPQDHEKHLKWTLPLVDCNRVHNRIVQEKRDLQFAKTAQYGDLKHTYQTGLHAREREGGIGIEARREQLERTLSLQKEELDKVLHQRFKTPSGLNTRRSDELVDDPVIAKVLQDEEIKARLDEISELENIRRQLQMKTDPNSGGVIDQKTLTAQSQERGDYHRSPSTSSNGRYSRPDHSIGQSELQGNPSRGHGYYTDPPNRSLLTDAERRRSAELQEKALDHWKKERGSTTFVKYAD